MKCEPFLQSIDTFIKLKYKHNNKKIFFCFLAADSKTSASKHVEQNREFWSHTHLFFSTQGIGPCYSLKVCSLAMRNVLSLPSCMKEWETFTASWQDNQKDVNFFSYAISVFLTSSICFSSWLIIFLCPSTIWELKYITTLEGRQERTSN